MRLKELFVGGILYLACIAASFADTTRELQVGVAGNIHAQLMMPDGPGPYPGILLLHTSGGLQPGDTDYGKRLVGEGYAVLIPEFLDAYGITAKSRQITFTSYAEPLYADFMACLELLRSDSRIVGKKLAAIGFSNGGYFALWLAATGQVKLGISYYGALTGAGSDRSMSRFQGAFGKTSSPVVLLHGADDSTVRFEFAAELDKMLATAQAPHALYKYEGAGHRFDRDRGAANEAASQDAWQRTRVALRTMLQE